MTARLTPPACLALVLAAGSAAAADLDLTRAAVVTPPGLDGPAAKAVRMLVEEVDARSMVRWDRPEKWPAGGVPVVVVGPGDEVRKLLDARGVRVPAPAPRKPEGYQIGAAGGVVWVAGNDARGVLFGVGRLLRELRLDRLKVTLPADFKEESAPTTPLRGHQVGYRPKTNSYDGWTVPMWEQYVRDLVVFGCNAVELIPPRSDDAADSPLFPLPPLRVWEPDLKGPHADATWWYVVTQSSGFDYPYGDHPSYRPGRMWTYSDKNPKRLTNALAKVYSRAGYEDDYAAVLRAAYFDAIGARGWKASLRHDGAVLDLDLEDMGRLGLLVLARGRWAGGQLVPQRFVETLETKQTYGVGANYDGPDDGRIPMSYREAPYGYMTWVNTAGDVYPKADRGWAWGAGAGGHGVFWNHKLGIVFAAHGRDRGFPFPGGDRGVRHRPRPAGGRAMTPGRRASGPVLVPSRPPLAARLGRLRTVRKKKKKSVDNRRSLVIIVDSTYSY